MPQPFKPPVPKGYVTYAVFHVHEKGQQGLRAKLVEVKDRNLATLDFPPEAHEFYFCDAPSLKDTRDPLRDETNLSAYYAIASEIITSDELIARLTEKGVILKNPPKQTRRNKQGNLLKKDVQHSIWLHKAKSTPYHAIAPNGVITQLSKHFCHTVIDTDKNIMMVWGDKTPYRWKAGEKPPSPELRKPAGRVVFKP